MNVNKEERSDNHGEYWGGEKPSEHAQWNRPTLLLHWASSLYTHPEKRKHVILIITNEWRNIIKGRRKQGWTVMLRRIRWRMWTSESGVLRRLHGLVCSEEYKSGALLLFGFGFFPTSCHLAHSSLFPISPSLYLIIILLLYVFFDFLLKKLFSLCKIKINVLHGGFSCRSPSPPTGVQNTQIKSWEINFVLLENV